MQGKREQFNSNNIEIIWDFGNYDNFSNHFTYIFDEQYLFSNDYYVTIVVKNMHDTRAEWGAAPPVWVMPYSLAMEETQDRKIDMRVGKGVEWLAIEGSSRQLRDPAGSNASMHFLTWKYTEGKYRMCKKMQA